MAILHKLLCFSLVLVILGAGGYAQPDFEETLCLAQQGDAEAQYFLGIAYYQGKGVLRDYQEAVKWFRKAAEQGYALAQAFLGAMYVKGEGVPQDYQEAAKWFQLAAGQGDAEAQSVLGVMYHNGEGVPRDYVRSHMWLNLNLSQETDEDKRKEQAERLNSLEKRMTTEQIAEAQKLAREFKPKGKN